MSAIDRLVANYARQVRLPWAATPRASSVSGSPCIRPLKSGACGRACRSLRRSRWKPTTAGAPLTSRTCLPEWIAAHEYREAIFAEPEHFSANSELEDLAVERVRQACASEEVDAASVVAITGLATLFDFMRVSSLIERVEDSVRGRLLVLFPGEYAGNVYRFMDARDGFNYMAVPITSTESFHQLP
jgi:hypothetical protein